MEFYRIAIKEDVSEVDIEQVAELEQWQLIGFIPLGNEQKQQEKIWLTASGKHQVHHIIDTMIQVQYFLVSGEEAKAAIEVLSSMIPCYNRLTMLDALKAAVEPAQFIKYIHRLAVSTGPEMDDAILNWLIIGMQHKNQYVRYESVLVSAYAAWQELKPILQEIEASDDIVENRQLASTLLQSFVEKGWRN